MRRSITGVLWCKLHQHFPSSTLTKLRRAYYQRLLVWRVGRNDGDPTDVES